MSTSGELSQQPHSERSSLDWLRLWFLLRDPVHRREYALTGFGLMAIKYIVEFVTVLALTGLTYTPLDFVNPLMSAREKFAHGAPPWFGFLWVLWALPFLWIAVGMSVRRAFDAGISPWHGLWVLVPFLNLPAMLILACLPTAAHQTTRWADDQRMREVPYKALYVAPTVKAAIGGIAIGALYASVLTQASVFLFHSYGAAIFFGTPLVTGVASSYLLNAKRSHSQAASALVAAAAIFFFGIALMLFAFEGAICIAMAAPIVLPLGMAGAPIGKFLADRRRRRRDLVSALLVLPMLTIAESYLPAQHEFVVASHIDIAAPREVVWQNVIGFARISDAPEWIFRLGVACPQEARIVGRGVGAQRHCIFTTGEFVEPITVWQQPRRLAFDVSEQPSPMFELTPYRNIHPPHLDLAFRSVRGEFELTELPNGGTRLTGRTWYTLDIRPEAYWTIWSDWLVHRIHMRVLTHIKQLAEQRGADS